MKKPTAIIILLFAIFLLMGCSTTVDKSSTRVQNDYYAVLSILQESYDRQLNLDKENRRLSEEELDRIKEISEKYEDWTSELRYPNILHSDLYNKYEKDVIWEIIYISVDGKSISVDGLLNTFGHFSKQLI